MHSTLREIRNFVFSANNLVAYLCASVLCVLIAPFSSGEHFSLPMLIAYWFTSNAVTLATGEVTMMGIMGMAPRSGSGRILAMIGGSVLSGILVTVIVFIINTLFYGRGGDIPGLLNLAKITWPMGFMIAISVGFVSERLRTENQNGNFDPQPTSAFFKRLPVHLGKELLHLTVQDHYVEAVTIKGKHLILMRFSDALNELESVEGIQVHRSHWIAKDAVTGTARKGGRLILRTSDEREFPVSRSYIKQTREFFQLG